MRQLAPSAGGAVVASLANELNDQGSNLDFQIVFFLFSLSRETKTKSPEPFLQLTPCLVAIYYVTRNVLFYIS